MKVWMKLTLVAGLTSACAPVAFDAVPLDSTNGPSSLFSNFFKMDVSHVEFEQPTLESNETQLVFQALLANGNHVTDLKQSDVEILENGRAVPGIQLKANSQKIEQTVDIVFAVDITGSMEPTIESAKMRLINFVNKSRASGHHTRMCLITFGDFTVKKCDRFYDNNPKDPKTEVQVRELISEISKLRALVGFNDPGGSDLNENPMRALIDAADSPWAEKSQRFVILVTDDGFLYSPGNQGTVGNLAPRYPEVLSALQRSQMKVFAATPQRAGYNLPFQGSPGIVEASLGEWFNFSSLISGTITLDTILNRIIERVQTNYVVQYKIEESMGFDPTIPLADRKIEVKLKDGRVASTVIQSVQSNLPNGRENYKKRFKIGSAKKIHRDSLKVYVDGKRQTEFEISEDGDLELPKAPKAKSKIEAYFTYSNLKDAVNLEVILIRDPDVNSAADLAVLLNGKLASPEDIDVVETLEGDLSLRLQGSVLENSDRYAIRDNGGLEVKVLTNRVRALDVD